MTDLSDSRSNEGVRVRGFTLNAHLSLMEAIGLWLAFKLFGSGYGLGAPSSDQTFYWLAGRFYTWFGGFGAQLQSFEFRCPKPGEERTIAGRHFRPFNVSRTWPMWRVSWATDRINSVEDIRDLEKAIKASA
jgi:hypothetical protein